MGGGKTFRGKKVVVFGFFPDASHHHALLLPYTRLPNIRPARKQCDTRSPPSWRHQVWPVIKIKDSPFVWAESQKSRQRNLVSLKIFLILDPPFAKKPKFGWLSSWKTSHQPLWISSFCFSMIQNNCQNIIWSREYHFPSSCKHHNRFQQFILLKITWEEAAGMSRE